MSEFSWLFSAMVAGVVFGAVAVPARRRWDIPGLISVALATAIIAVVTGWMWIDARSPVSGEEFGHRLLVTSAVGSAIAGSLAVHRIVKRASIPDPLVEGAAGAAAFVGGALIGAWLGLTGPMVG